MKIERARILPFCLPLREPLATAHGPIGERRGLLLGLPGEAGALEGFGEAAPLPGFGLETLSYARRALADIAQWLEGRSIDDLGALLDEIERRWSDAPAARSAADVALHDLAAQARGWSVARLLRAGADPRESVASCALLGGAFAALASRARAAADRGFETLKLKLGGHGLDEDRRRVAQVRHAVGEGVRLRLDVNQAWKEPEAATALESLAEYQIEFVEEPVAEGLEALARVRAGSSIPIAADESACGEAAAARVIERRAADVLVLKPTAAGGLRAASRIAESARAAGIEVVVGSFLDSAVGVAAALALAAALPGPLAAAGLETSALLARDVAPPLQSEAGRLALPGAAGLGIRPERSGLPA